MRDVETCRQAAEPAAFRPDRRRFLMAGAGCAAPLVAGGLAWSRPATSPAPGPGLGAQVESVLDHLRRELARNYHAMRGPAGIRGEHLRSLAANLDLIGVCLESAGRASRIDGALRKSIEEKGRDTIVAECVVATEGVLADLSLEYGVEARPGRNAGHASAALDLLAARGVLVTLREPRPVLNRLGALLDRQDADRSVRRRVSVVHQKPGDDFLGYPPGSVFSGLTLCQLIEALDFSLEVLAGVLALTGAGTGVAGAVLLVSASLELVKLVACKKDSEV